MNSVRETGRKKLTALCSSSRIEDAESYAAAQAVVDAALCCNPELNSRVVSKYQRAVLVQRVLKNPLLTRHLFDSSELL